MRKSAVVLMLSAMVLSAIPAFAASITEKERDSLVQQFDRTAKKFRDSVAGLTEAQANFKPSPDKWSVAECAEHIALSESVIRGLVDKTLQAPVKEEGREERAARDQFIAAAIVDRSKKAQAPEFLQPKRKFATLAETVAAFDAARKSNVDLARTTQDDLRGHVTPHPAFKEMDVYQWMLLIALHSERHTLQILEVKADPGFPKR